MADYVSIFTREHETQIDPKKDVLLLKVNAMMSRKMLDALYFEIFEQYKKGVVMIPSFVDFAIISGDTDILTEKESKTDVHF